MRRRHLRKVPLKASSLEVDIANLPDEEPRESTEKVTPVDDSLPEDMLTFPRHSMQEVNEILVETENLIRNMHKHSKKIDPQAKNRKSGSQREDVGSYDAIFANTYVDLGKVDTVGFDYDYTLVT